MPEVPPDNDDDIARLLSDLKDKTPEYPAELLAKRRAAYQQRTAGLGIGLAIGGAAKGGLLHSAWSIEGVLKALIVTALAVEGVGGAILYRQSLLESTSSTPTPTLTVTQQPPTWTSTPTPTATPTASATLIFAPDWQRDDNGLHLGQTPTPPGKRTRTP